MTSRSTTSWWRELPIRRRAGGALVISGAGLTVLLAFVGNVDEAPSASTQALLAFFAIAAQLGGAWTFSGEGRADPTLAQRSVSRLVRLAQRTAAARGQAEGLTTRGAGSEELRDGMGHLSVHLSYIEEGTVDAVEDWRVFHPRAVRTAEYGQEGTDVDDE